MAMANTMKKPDRDKSTQLVSRSIDVIANAAQSATTYAA
jgi:hypothetical protein